MNVIGPKTSRKQLAAIVVSHLKNHGIEAVLVGGSVVSIYTDNKYESRDLDFISDSDHGKIAVAMKELGFSQKGKDFLHANTHFTVEFPTGPLGIGGDQPIKAEGKLKVGSVTIYLLSPTQSVMDRLAWFFFSNDRQCLDQAVWIAQSRPIKLEKIKAWAKRENEEEKLKIFLDRIKKQSAKK
jgi:hypothetical protein